jgi:hypothetical protein
MLSIGYDQENFQLKFVEINAVALLLVYVRFYLNQIHSSKCPYSQNIHRSINNIAVIFIVEDGGEV